MLSTPVAIIIFRRPDLTAKVLDVVRLAKPSSLYVIADGPRKDKPGEAEACAATRAVIDTVDWDCEVHRHYSDVNLGCGYRPSSGIDWLFDQVESAIILEDDCIPHPSFFGYCDELLQRYRDDERVMHISGCTYRAEPWHTDSSYFFSRFPAAWGWATWRRAWKYYDIKCKDWPALRGTGFLADLIGEPVVEAFWAKQFDEASLADQGLHFWDYQWAFACWANSGLAIFPRQNLVSNIGSGEHATHTVDKGWDWLFLPTFEMPLPLKHPVNVLHDADLDRAYVRQLLLPIAIPAMKKPSTGAVAALRRLLPRPFKRMAWKVIR